MEEVQTKPTQLRPLWLTVAFCIMSIIAAVDISFGSVILGHALMMAMLGLYAVILMTCERYVAVLNAVGALAVFYFTSGDLSLAAFGAVVLISAIILFAGIRKRCAKTAAVLAVSISVTVGYLAVMAIFYAAEGNSLALSDLFTQLNGFFDVLKANFADAIRTMFSSLPEETVKVYENYGYTMDDLIAVSIVGMEYYVDYVQVLLPGLVIALFEFMAFFAVFSFATTVRVSHLEAIFPEPRWVIYPTQVSCIVYTITLSVYVIASFFSATSSFSIIVTNFWLVLMPTMLICGFRSLSARLKHPRFRRQTIIIIVLFVIGFFFLADAVLELAILTLTFIGVQDASASRALESRINRRGE